MNTQTYTKKLYSKMNVPRNCRVLAPRVLEKEICEYLNKKTFSCILDFLHEYCGGYLTSNVWTIVVKFLIQYFDYDADAVNCGHYDVAEVKYGRFLTRIPEPIFVPVIEYFDNRGYMSFTVYNKNPGVDKLCDSMTVFLPINKSVKTIVIIVEGREFVCSNINEIRNATNAWIYWLFSSTVIDKMLT